MFEDYKPKYVNWTAEDYANSDLRYCEPMTAHALETEEDQLAQLGSSDNYLEEKFDGTRGILHFLADGCRVFSRRISKKTNWFTENTDALPHMSQIAIPELSGTVIDGEIFITNRPFKDISATLNCTWDKAIQRQNEIGFAVFHVFDVLYYRGVRVERMTLEQRKNILSLKIMPILARYTKKYSVNAEFPIQEVDYRRCGNAEECFKYYETIVKNGGEGVIVKNKSMPYEHKRSKAFLKIKKFYTREVIITGFSEPTKYYEGKFPDDKWDFWEKPNKEKVYLPNGSAKHYLKQGYLPITRYYYYDWVGNIQFSVVIPGDEIGKLPKNKQHKIININAGEIPNRGHMSLLEVGECSGFDDEIRESLTEKDLYRVIEVKCNEIFKDTGKLRHPRFLRFRDDKDMEECTYMNHISEGV